jgi:indolepyruvate ferredoxin oxidoreductase beta subunit
MDQQRVAQGDGVTTTRPITILIAALGGEGGGVLTNWIVTAATDLGFPVQSTSIPGVAQRTGATTYYIEIVPVPAHTLGNKRPVLALTPGIGDIDVVIASEFMEAGRSIASGFVTPDRTLLIASTSRFYVMNEKIAMGDGRYDQKRLSGAIESNSQRSIVLDMDALSKTNGAIVNAVMLGVLAGSDKLPIPAEKFEAAIRADGKAIDNNLRGFQAGLAAARAKPAAATANEDKRGSGTKENAAAMEREIRMWMPIAAQDVMIEGVRRLIAYQDAKYARLYVDRLSDLRAADEHAGSDGRLLRETARHLAVRMSYEDVIRVAQAKIDPARLQRIASDLGVTAGQPFKIVEFLKPGIEEICQILPPWPARWILYLSQKHRWLDRVHLGMEVNTTSITGYLRFWMLAKLRPLRRRTFRYAQEHAAIESWLTLIKSAANTSAELAIEIAECARLIKGYGSTHKRGTDNYRSIKTHVILPTLEGHLAVRRGIDAIASARTAALVDPEGEGLQRCIDALEHGPMPAAAE